MMKHNKNLCNNCISHYSNRVPVAYLQVRWQVINSSLAAVIMVKQKLEQILRNAMKNFRHLTLPSSNALVILVVTNRTLFYSYLKMSSPRQYQSNPCLLKTAIWAMDVCQSESKCKIITMKKETRPLSNITPTTRRIQRMSC